MLFKQKEVFSEEQQQQIAAAIANAEKQTSGEIKVHIEPYCKTDPYMRAQQVFAALELHKTAERNGVLFYLAFDDHKFAILGDEGIHKKVGQNFWDTTKELMATRFKNQQFAEGLCEGIQMAGQQLVAHFPYAADDRDELSNDISFGGHDE
jgi:uncharacterized membrane protein